ncbi:hypothetical protein evm_005490 [Chilo suppressalis]|nr:hypothetical protein evm_005490 [Chilo suppressalis]
MSAIQNGERGVTIAEIRNRPPLIIRKGLMYRCPINRALKEPDGSGIIMCEEDIEPSPVMFDACLSAEDRDVYVADKKYFFCNRHRVEGPDLPLNGSAAIACAPMERTSLNYTSLKCALEDSDDVVVHYRYYPDKSYKNVYELDPDREVCEHWDPCQIGYIYSLPSADQALPAHELWHDTVYEHVPISTITGNTYITTSPRRLRIPSGYKFDGVWRVKDPYSGKKSRRNVGNDTIGMDGTALRGGNSVGRGIGAVNGSEIDDRFDLDDDIEFYDDLGLGEKDVGVGNREKTKFNVGAMSSSSIINTMIKLSTAEYAVEYSADNVIFITMRFLWRYWRLGPYYALFTKEENGKKMEKTLDILRLEKTAIQMQEAVPLELNVGRSAETQYIQFMCVSKCELTRIMVRTNESKLFNLDPDRYRVMENDETHVIELNMKMLKPRDVGFYYAVFRTEENEEENIQIINPAAVDRHNSDDTLSVTPPIPQALASVSPAAHWELHLTTYLIAGLSYDRIGELGHDPPREPSADWRVLTTADARDQRLNVPTKAGGTRDRRFLVTHPMADHCESCLTSRSKRTR